MVVILGARALALAGIAGGASGDDAVGGEVPSHPAAPGVARPFGESTIVAKRLQTAASAAWQARGDREMTNNATVSSVSRGHGHAQGLRRAVAIAASSPSTAATDAAAVSRRLLRERKLGAGGRIWDWQGGCHCR